MNKQTRKLRERIAQRYRCEVLHEVDDDSESGITSWNNCEKELKNRWLSKVDWILEACKDAGLVFITLKNDMPDQLIEIDLEEAQHG